MESSPSIHSISRAQAHDPSPASGRPRTWVDQYRHLVHGKTRIWIAWAFALTLGLLSRKQPAFPGLLVCFVGAGIRFWASGFLRKNNRLAVGGPYAHVRNPLYFGTWLMALGIGLSTSSWIFVGLLAVIFPSVYHYVILGEEEKLERIFGAPYRRYLELVPRFFWRIRAVSSDLLHDVNPFADDKKFSWEIARENRAHEALVSFAGLWLYCAAWAWFWSWMRG